MLGQFDQLLNAITLEFYYARGRWSSKGRFVLTNMRWLARHLYR